MGEMTVKTLTGEDVVLGENAIEEIRTGIRGEVLRGGDHGYEQASKVWNGMIDKRPGLIVQSAGVADVISAVNFARENNLLPQSAAVLTVWPVTRRAKAGS